jgi:hypothetical protein
MLCRKAATFPAPSHRKARIELIGEAQDHHEAVGASPTTEKVRTKAIGPEPNEGTSFL